MVLMTQIGLLVVIMIANAPPVPLAAANDLSGYAWQHRPLIVFTPDLDDAKFRKQAVFLAIEKYVMLERDMVLIEVIGDEVHTRHGPRLGQDADALRKQLDIYPDQFAVILIGKDTGIKLRSQIPVDAGTIAALIDSMPMRQHEGRSPPENSAQTED